MACDFDPYESPSSGDEDPPAPPFKRPPVGTVLVIIWTREAGIKTYFLGTMFLRGFNPRDFLAQDYRSWNRLAFFLVAGLFLIETIGPWIGTYYLI